MYTKNKPKIGSGPDKYYDIKSFVDLNLTNGRKISLGKRPAPISGAERKKSSEPGPGQYPIQTTEGITHNGRHVNSKIKNLPNFNFGFSVGEKVSSI